MNKFLLFILCFSFLNGIQAQKNKNLCKVEVHDVSVVTSFGYLVSYVVQFKNNSPKNVDGIYWTVKYYNNNNELISSEESSFNSSSLIDPIASGVTKSIARVPKLKGASKAFIIIDKLHFTDGSSCK